MNITRHTVPVIALIKTKFEFDRILPYMHEFIQVPLILLKKASSSQINDNSNIYFHTLPNM